MEASQQQSNKRHDLEEGVSTFDPNSKSLCQQLLTLFVLLNTVTYMNMNVCVYVGDAS